VRGGTAEDEPPLGELIDDACEVRRVNATSPRELLERRRVADLEPPQQLRLRVRQPQRLEAAPLMVERQGEEIHEPGDDLLLRLGDPLNRHYRYFTAFLPLVQSSLLALTPLVQHFRLPYGLWRFRLRWWIVLLEPACSLVVGIEPRRPLALAPLLCALRRQLSFPAHERRVASPKVFDHITIRVADRAAAERFYNTVLSTLGVGEPWTHNQYTLWGHDFSLAQDDQPITSGLHIGFVAPSRAHVDEFWRVGTEAGYEDDGAPGLRPQYGDTYYGGFLRDPDGNSVEAVHLDSLRAGGDVDHLWIRVADVPTSQAFYETIAPFAGFGLKHSTPERAQFADENGSFSVVAGKPTTPFHLAFAATEDRTVDEFHRAAIEAGYSDNGAPGERAIYHPGYYGAFVLDPDGNNVEVVNHNRA
jgi:catechol 2,3-dioxygenase-like lactoylglutathione lyase family enzyme